MENVLQQLQNALQTTEAQLFRLLQQRDGLLNQIHIAEMAVKQAKTTANEVKNG